MTPTRLVISLVGAALTVREIERNVWPPVCKGSTTSAADQPATTYAASEVPTPRRRAPTLSQTPRARPLRPNEPSTRPRRPPWRETVSCAAVPPRRCSPACWPRHLKSILRTGPHSWDQGSLNLRCNLACRCPSSIKPLLAASAVGMWATRLRCPSEAAYPQSSPPPRFCPCRRATPPSASGCSSPGEGAENCRSSSRN